MIKDKFCPIAAVRVSPDTWLKKCPVVEVGEIDATTDWSSALVGIESIIHTAARVHVMNEFAIDPLAEFRKVNVDGTLNLARQAAKVGVKKFIFLSSIKVNGESTQQGVPFTESDLPHPEDPYGKSKLEAEDGLRIIAKQTKMKVVIIRPVLVYGPGVKGNFELIIRCLKKRVPLPLGAINNSRSFISLDNLIDFILTCLQSSAAENQTFLVSDGDDISTTQLLRLVAFAINIKARLFPVPIFIILLGASLLGKKSSARRLCGNLEVDIHKARELLGWNPPNSVRKSLVFAFSKKVE